MDSIPAYEAAPIATVNESVNAVSGEMDFIHTPEAAISTTPMPVGSSQVKFDFNANALAFLPAPVSITTTLNPGAMEFVPSYPHNPTITLNPAAIEFVPSYLHNPATTLSPGAMEFVPSYPHNLNVVNVPNADKQNRLPTDQVAASPALLFYEGLFTYWYQF